MLLRDFKHGLSAEIVRRAAERYFDLAYEILPGGVVANKLVVKILLICSTNAITMRLNSIKFKIRLASPYPKNRDTENEGFVFY